MLFTSKKCGKKTTVVFLFLLIQTFLTFNMFHVTLNKTVKSKDSKDFLKTRSMYMVLSEATIPLLKFLSQYRN